MAAISESRRAEAASPPSPIGTRHMQIPDIQRQLRPESSDNAPGVRRANSAGTQPIREPRRTRVVPLPADNKTTIAHLKDLVRTFCEARDWDQFHNAKDLAIGISTEAAELLEHFRFQSEDDVRELFEDPARRQEIANELADVLIFVLRFGQRFEVDLAGAVSERLAHNETRYPVARAHGSNCKAESPRRSPEVSPDADERTSILIAVPNHPCLRTPRDRSAK